MSQPTSKERLLRDAMAQLAWFTTQVDTAQTARRRGFVEIKLPLNTEYIQACAEVFWRIRAHLEVPTHEPKVCPTCEDSECAVHPTSQWGKRSEQPPSLDVSDLGQIVGLIEDGEYDKAIEYCRSAAAECSIQPPPADAALATAIARVEDELSLFGAEPVGYSEFATDLHVLIAHARAAPPPGRDAEDVARYRWIKQHLHIANNNPRNWAIAVKSLSMDFDAAIDAERSAPTKSSEHGG